MSLANNTRTFGLLGLLACSLLSGCATVRLSQDEVLSVDGEPVKGSERRYVDVSRMTNEWHVSKPEYQTFTVTAKGTKEWQVERFSETWESRINERGYAIAGRNEGYSLGADIIVDPILAAIGVIMYPFAVFADDKNIGRSVSQWILAVLPGISTIPDPKRPIKTTTRKLKNRVPLDPATRTDDVEAWMDLLVYDGEEQQVFTTPVAAGRSVEVNACEYALRSLGHPSVTFVVTSKTAEVRGAKTLAVRFDESELIRRMAAAQKADPKGVKQSYVLDADFTIDDKEEGNGDGTLRAGERVSLVMTAKNSGKGTGYGLGLLASIQQGDIEIGKPPLLTQVREKTTVSASLPLSVPLKAPDGVARLEVTAMDAAGASSPPVTVQIPYTHRPLPSLQVGSIDIQPAVQGEVGDFDVLIRIRNRGDGESERTKLAVSGKPSAGRVVRGEVDLGTLAPHSQTQGVLRINGAGTEADISTIRVTLTERLGVGSDEKDLEIPIP